MTKDAILTLFERMKAEKWTYVWGAAQKGCVDCSGAFVYAFRVLDSRSMYHGSNYMARNEVEKLLPISQAEPGMIAFKLRKPGAKYYALPDRYKASGDTNDYYHVGLVSRDGKTVLNAASVKAGFITSPLSQWACVGRGKHIDYEGETAMKTMVVTADSGSTVNRRTKPDASSPILDRIKVGTQVQVVATDGTWSTVQHDGATGYMMSKYLQAEGGEDALTLEALAARITALEARVSKLEGADA